MTRPAPTPATLRRLLATLFVAGATMLAASPASAQYGGAVDLFVDPTRVEIDGTFDYFGSNCPAGSTVSITIDGVPGVLANTIAFDDSSYAGTAVGMPSGVVAGQDYTVRASCAGSSDIAVIRAVCNGGTDPVDGVCPDGQTVGGQDPTATTTTPGSGSAGGAGGNGTTGGNGATGGNAGSSPDLAVTGAGFAEQSARIGITLVALGAVLLLAATKRRERAAA